jgi:rhodanese-related sulfurtransferase
MKFPAFLFILFLVACSQAPQVEEKQSATFQNLPPEKVKELLDNKEEMGLFVLNVHTPYEGELEKTDAFIEDWQNIAAHIGQLPSDKSAPILVYCRSGRMSEAAVKQMQDLGYTNIYHLNGGMKAWDSQGLPIKNKSFK